MLTDRRANSRCQRGREARERRWWRHAVRGAVGGRGTAGLVNGEKNVLRGVAFQRCNCRPRPDQSALFRAHVRALVSARLCQTPSTTILYVDTSYAGGVVQPPMFQLTARTACRKEIWIPEVARAYTCQANAADGHSYAGGGRRERSEGGALDEKKEASALSMQRRSVHNAAAAGGGGGGGAEATDIGKLEWHQALSLCPGLPILVIGTKSELADAASRAGGVTQDAKLLSPLSYARPRLHRYRQQTGS